MTVREEVQAVLDRYTFGTILVPFQPRLRVSAGTPYPTRNGRVRCELQLTVPERETGDPYNVCIGLNLTHNGPLRETHHAVMAAFFDHLEHELNEALRFDDELVFDAHQRSSRWRP